MDEADARALLEIMTGGMESVPELDQKSIVETYLAIRSGTDRRSWGLESLGS